MPRSEALTKINAVVRSQCTPNFAHCNSPTKRDLAAKHIAAQFVTHHSDQPQVKQTDRERRMQNSPKDQYALGQSEQ